MLTFPNRRQGVFQTSFAIVKLLKQGAGGGKKNTKLFGNMETTAYLCTTV
jgi:hypothetical protein